MEISSMLDRLPGDGFPEIARAGFAVGTPSEVIHSVGAPSRVLCEEWGF
jgi:hypothetical protein